MKTSLYRSFAISAVLLLAWVPAFSGSSAVFPYFVQAVDLNPCTGELITLTYDGTVRIHEAGGHVVAHFSGSVVTSDGATGRFNGQEVMHGDQVYTLVVHDMDSFDSHQRMKFNGLFHITVVDGRVTAEVLNLSLSCVGKP